MKILSIILVAFLILHCHSSNANTIKNPIREFQVFNKQFITDNPKGKLKIRFISTIDKSDTTNRPKGLFAKIKNILNAVLDASDNPPFKIEIVREKKKKN